MVLGTASGVWPLVTCLMVTRPDRFAQLVTSVGDYCRQSYPARELVVVTDTAPSAAVGRIEGHIASLGRSDITLVTLANKPPLGSLRNSGVRAARGEMICQWDDDDRHHPARIAEQAAALTRSGRPVCLLRDVFQFFPGQRQLRWTNWTRTPARGHPGTIMADRRAALRYPETGPEARAGEDLAVLADLLRTDGVHTLADAPHLFVYVTHGGNTWPANHHRMLADRLSLSRGLLLRREVSIREGLAPLTLAAEDVAVTGANGWAFTLAGSGAPAQ